MTSVRNAVALAFFNEYITYRSQETWQNAPEKIKNVLKVGFNYLCNGTAQAVSHAGLSSSAASIQAVKFASNQVTKTAICDKFIALILTADDDEKSLELNFQLGNEGRTILETEPESLLAQTIFAVQAYNVYTQKKQNFYKDKVKELKASATSLFNEMKEQYNKDEDITAIRKQWKETLYQLIDLHDESTIFSCEVAGWFDSSSSSRFSLPYKLFDSSQIKTKNRPPYYQDVYHLIHHENMQARHGMKESFTDFECNAIHNFKNSHENHKYRLKEHSTMIPLTDPRIKDSKRLLAPKSIFSTQSSAEPSFFSSTESPLVSPVSSPSPNVPLPLLWLSQSSSTSTVSARGCKARRPSTTDSSPANSERSTASKYLLRELTPARTPPEILYSIDTDQTAQRFSISLMALTTEEERKSSTPSNSSVSSIGSIGIATHEPSTTILQTITNTTPRTSNSNALFQSPLSFPSTTNKEAPPVTTATYQPEHILTGRSTPH